MPCNKYFLIEIHSGRAGNTGHLELQEKEEGKVEKHIEKLIRKRTK